MGIITVIITLTSIGTDLGPIDLYTDSDNFVTPIETGLNVALFATGYHCHVVPDDATIIRVQSTGICDNYIDISIGNIPTPSPTPNVTPSPTPNVTPSQTPSNTPPPSSTPAANTYTISFSPVVVQDYPYRQIHKSFVTVTPALPVGHSFRLYFENYASTDATDTLEFTITATADMRYVTGGYNYRAQSYIEEGQNGNTSDIVNGSQLFDSTILSEIYFYASSESNAGNDERIHEVYTKVRMVTVNEETGGGTYIIDPVNYLLESTVTGPFEI